MNAGRERLRVGFTGSCRASFGGYAHMADTYWADKPKPPPPLVERYKHPEYPWMTWRPRPDDRAPQAARIKQASGLTRIELDSARCRFAYDRVRLVGSVVLDPERLRRSGRVLRADDAVGVVVMSLQWTLLTVYNQRGSDGGVSTVDLPGLAVSVRELERTTLLAEPDTRVEAAAGLIR
jgi:hypothetical protein